MALERVIAGSLDHAIFLGARVSMLLVFAPFFSSTAIPSLVKASLTVAITVILLPASPPVPQVQHLATWMQILGGEAMVGLALGLVLNFVFEGIQMAGTVAGFQLGYSLETSFDPTTQAASPVLTVLFQMISLLFFLQLGIHRWILLELAKSYRYLPVGTVRLTLAGMFLLLRSSGEIFTIGIELSAPILVATMLTDLALGFVNRAAPQFPVVFTSISIKVLMGLVLLIVSLGFWPGLLRAYFQGALGTGMQILKLW